MSYQVLSQKYRPQTFDDVIGQETVTRTLKNSIANDRTANAYIFCGPRGVGKTSIARLLSKTLNCENPVDGGPCNKCESCLEITQGNNIDVLEIDGASNNGVDQIRTLRENVKFSPSKSKFKIYIIDEIHMLSTGAFNALLKTLEEPPAHVKFIFATTEPHKVLPTIMSRCQRFDFKRISPKMVFERVVDIAKKEKIEIDEKAILLIARAADGSMRDGLVVLDQMISFSGEKITAEDVVELLGVVHKDEMFELSGAVIDNDPVRVATKLDDMISSGKDPVFIANSLIGHYRDLMIFKTTGAATADMVFSDDEIEKIKAQLEKVSLEEILYILQNLSHCLNLMKGTSFVRAPLEIVLIRLTRRGAILALPEIYKKLNDMGSQDYACQDSSVNVDNVIKRTDSYEEKKPDIQVDDIQKSEKAIVVDNVIDSSEDEPEKELSAGERFKESESHWRAILNYVKTKKISAYAFLCVAKPVQINKDKVVIGFGKDHVFNKETLETESYRGIIEEAAQKVTGTSNRVEFTILDFLSDSPDENTVTGEAKNKVKEDMKPSIEKAMDVFGGHIVRDLMEEK